MPARTGRIAASLLALGAAGEAMALEYCVSCEGPAAMYRCVVEGTPDGPGSDPGTSLYCISEMAAKGRHQSCSVARGAPFPCPGFTAVIAAPRTAPMEAAPPAAAGNDAPAPEAEDAPHAEAAPPAPDNKVPRTVEELAGQTVRSSKEGIEKAGQAIGGTAKKAGEHLGDAGSAIGNAASKTWSCITSFFSDCGDEAEDQPAPPEPHPAD